MSALRRRTPRGRGPGSVVAIALALVGCGDPPRSDGTADGTATDSTASGGTTVSTGPATADETGSTTGPSSGCPARRHTLLLAEACESIAFGDLDADGIGDLLVVPGGLEFLPSATVWKRAYSFTGGDPLLSAPEVHCCFDAGSILQTQLYDINGDGRDDPLITALRTDFSGDVGTSLDALQMQIRGPQGGYLGRRFLSQVPSAFGSTPQVALGELLPGARAVAVAEGTQLALFEAEGIALVRPESALALPEPVRDLGAIDLDDDGIDDLAALLGASVLLLSNSGAFTFEVGPQSVPPALGPRLRIAQLDGAAAPELVIAGPEGIAVGTLDDDPLGISWQLDPLVVEGPLALADVDADGLLDLVTVLDDQLVAHLGGGDGSFAPVPLPLSSGVGERVAEIGAGDLDGDGRSELVVCDEQGIVVVTP